MRPLMTPLDADVVLALASVQIARDRVRREDFALYVIPFWRFLRRARQESRLLDAKVALVAAENALATAKRTRAEAQGAA